MLYLIPTAENGLAGLERHGLKKLHDLREEYLAYLLVWIVVDMLDRFGNNGCHFTDKDTLSLQGDYERYLKRTPIIVNEARSEHKVLKEGSLNVGGNLSQD